jgi:hypothetical protein
LSSAEVNEGDSVRFRENLQNIPSAICPLEGMVGLLEGTKMILSPALMSFDLARVVFRKFAEFKRQGLSL